ncbi:hypothetical protein B0A48_13715 [Cryoendolithus antarcticus]|uniref:EthD domain-containing protein n=1 Tax=Cryoendolithus antarcticus TaxID=1507870 RepID=A0A1V8SMG7_9PEZI|nr:hypothetical protein B0A48_13715 [Cryoendolithus antarcticus]
MRQSIQDLKQYLANVIIPQSPPETIAWISTDPDSQGKCDFDWKGYAVGFADSSDHGPNPLWQLRNTSPSTRFAGSHAGYRSFNVDKKVTVLVFGDVHASGLIALAESTVGSDARSAVSLYQLTHKFEPKRSQGLHGLCIVAVAIEPAEDGNDELDHWYRNEHLDLLAKVPIYLRTSRYTLLRPSENPARDLPPSHLALHEYTSSKDLLNYALQHGPLAPETEQSKRALGGAKHVERTVWEVIVP